LIIEAKVQHYPLDVTQLVKGQVLDILELEWRMGISWSDQEHWWSKLLTLKQQIERLRSDLELPLLTIKTRRGTLVICDDEDAARYNHAMGKRGIRRFVRASVRNIAVDTTKLSGDLAAAHERTIMRQAMMLTAIRSSQHRALPNQSEPQRV